MTFTWLWEILREQWDLKAEKFFKTWIDIMKLKKFSGGTAGVPVWINIDFVSTIQGDPDPDSKLTLITTQDGRDHRVKEGLDEVVKSLQPVD